ncbi:hypothetical protein AVEN_127789-1 [Araneus ventricosus]|uniref:Uncharacterized protein n=1 Tax=Araneus ventricosus TaxID=182803 RepID=A0A4Y2DNF6_ARAVE|nr:hypothetical protein AVEN_127789-1 [Araneus ventricosus]
MRCVYYCFMKCSEFSLKYGVAVVEFSRSLVGPDVIGQDAEGSSNSVFGFQAICDTGSWITNENMVEMLGSMAWPPNCPDLRPMNFFFWDK